MIEVQRKLIYSCLLIFSFFATASAQPELDITFNGTGKVTTSFSGSTTAFKPLVQPDNKIIAVGVMATAAGPRHFMLRRFNTNGSPDTSFGDQGIVLTDFQPFPTAIQGAWTGALQPDGKILAAGYLSFFSPGHGYYAMVRYNSDGTLDTTFGDGGRVQIRANAEYHEARAIAIGPDGKIVLAGFFLTSPQTYQTLITRFNPNGSTDMSFGNEGMVADQRGSVQGEANKAFATAIQPDGKILIGGSFGTANNLDITFARFNTDGTYDITFGAGGRLLLQSPTVSEGITALTLQPDGRILAAGFSGPDFLVMRLWGNGMQDITFSDDGRTTVSMGGTASANDLLLRPNGKILVTGPIQSVDRFSLASLNADGSPDSSFSGDGKLTFDFAGAFLTSSYGVALDGLGRPVLSGTSGSDIAMARLYTPDPVPVTISGQAKTPTGTPIRGARIGLIDQAGLTRWAISSNFGFFSFEGVPTGQTYNLFVRGSKTHIFESMDIGLNEATSVDLIGTPRGSKTAPISSTSIRKSQK